MAKKRGEGWVIFGLVTTGLVLLYYAQTGVGREKDSALLPNAVEGKIDALIAGLNQRFGKRWVDVGVVVLKHRLRNTLPVSFITLVDVVTAVENISKSCLMTSFQKQQLAVQMAGRGW